MAVIRAVVALPFALLALAGFVASVVVHLFALLGMEPPFSGARLMLALHGGIFVVFLPGMILAAVARGSAKGGASAGASGGSSGSGSDGRSAGDPGVKKPFKTVIAVLFGYAIVNFVAGVVWMLVSGDRTPGQVLMYRLFSGHWMLFYGVSVVMLWSAMSGAVRAPGVRCPNGHRIPPGAVSCPVCGVPAGGVVGVGTSAVPVKSGAAGRDRGDATDPELPKIIR